MAIVTHVRPTYHKVHIEFLPDGSTRRAEPSTCPDCYEIAHAPTVHIHARVSMDISDHIGYLPGSVLVKCGGIVDDVTMTVPGTVDYGFGTADSQEAFIKSRADTHCGDCWASHDSKQTIQ